MISSVSHLLEEGPLHMASFVKQQTAYLSQDIVLLSKLQGLPQMNLGCFLLVSRLPCSIMFSDLKIRNQR